MITPLAPSSPAAPGILPAARGFQRLDTIGYYGAFVALGMASAALGPSLPSLAEHTRSRMAEISILFVARSSGYLGGSLLGGRLFDRIAGHPVMGVALVLIAGMLGVAPLLSQLWLLAAFFLVLGVAEGALDVGGNTLLVWVHRDRVAPFMNALHFFFGLGALLSPLIIARSLLWGGGITFAFWALALLQLPAALWLLRLPTPASGALVAREAGGRGNGRLVALLVLFFALYTGAEVAFGGWIYSYAVALGLSSEAGAAYLTSTFWGTLTVGRLLAVPLAVRVPPRSLLLADGLGCLASLLVLLLARQSLAATFLGTGGLGLCMASIFPSALALAQGRLRITGQVTGWFCVGASIGGMGLPWLIGQFFESGGPHVTMVLLFGDMAAAVGVLAILTVQSARPFYQWIIGER
jgi:MFS transporter, FHS family, Na+ dependent glucose transporter 1